MIYFIIFLAVIEKKNCCENYVENLCYYGAICSEEGKEKDSKKKNVKRKRKGRWKWRTFIYIHIHHSSYAIPLSLLYLSDWISLSLSVCFSVWSTVCLSICLFFKKLRCPRDQRNISGENEEENASPQATRPSSEDATSRGQWHNDSTVAH